MVSAYVIERGAYRGEQHFVDVEYGFSICDKERSNLVIKILIMCLHTGESRNLSIWNILSIYYEVVVYSELPYFVDMENNLSQHLLTFIMGFHTWKLYHFVGMGSTSYLYYEVVVHIYEVSIFCRHGKYLITTFIMGFHTCRCLILSIWDLPHYWCDKSK